MLSIIKVFIKNSWRSAMGYKIRLSTVLIACITTSFAVTCLVAVLPLTSDFSDGCICTVDENTSEVKSFKRIFKDHKWKKHKLAVIVPFRDRFEELLMFAPHMNAFLTRQGINHHIFVINQLDQLRFNRASLINVGFLQTMNDFDYIAMHDVDLLPMNDNLSYDYPESGPFHIASPELHPRYHYSTYVGGILLLKKRDFEQVNGMSNRYWGWGLEDDEFYVRLKDFKLNISRPLNIQTGTTHTFSHIHYRVRKRDTAKCFKQKEETRKRDRETGLHNVQFVMMSRRNLTIDDVPVTVFNVELICDMKKTPWCDCSQANNSAKIVNKKPAS